MKLNGCTGCHKHVYTQDDKATLCPHCAHPRYNEAGKPNELVFYFPIKPKLQALMRLDAFKKMLEHENERPCNPNLMSDIYDSPAWREFMGPAASPIDRIELQACMDGIPAFASGQKSMKPFEAYISSLPPTERHKVKYMLLMMLIEDGMKHKAMKKYFDFAAEYELQDLYDNGVGGVKVKHFHGQSRQGRDARHAGTYGLHVVLCVQALFQRWHFNVNIMYIRRFSRLFTRRVCGEAKKGARRQRRV